MASWPHPGLSKQFSNVAYTLVALPTWQIAIGACSELSIEFTLYKLLALPQPAYTSVIEFSK